MIEVGFMNRALELAERGRYSVSPNPMVGCVLVRNGEIIGEGFHRKAGEPHAEIEAIRSASSEVAGATAYVTLEPCAHTGRTPPCTEALIDAGITQVVIASADPSPHADGAGVERLRAAGIKVSEGLLAAEADRLNEIFLHSAGHHRPFVLLKGGMSLDGKLATIERQSQWITSPDSREQSLALREEYDAILVGAGTIRCDDPMLTRRLGWNQSITPWVRVILDPHGSVAPEARAFSDEGRTLVFTGQEPSLESRSNVEIVRTGLRDGKIDLETVLDDLNRRGIRSLIVEGGAAVMTGFIHHRLWQKMMLFVAPMVIGGGDAPSIFAGRGVPSLTEAPRFRFDECRAIGPDLMITAYPEANHPG